MKPKRLSKGFSIPRSPRVGRMPSMYHRNKGKEKQGAGQKQGAGTTPRDPKGVRKPTMMDQAAGRSGVVGRRPGKVADHGGEPASPLCPDDDGVNQVVEETRRRRLLLQDESEDELPPLFASLGGAAREMEREPRDRGRATMKPHDLNVESGAPDHLKPQKPAATRKLTKASSHRSGPDKSEDKKQKDYRIGKKGQKADRGSSKQESIEAGNWVDVPVKEVAALSPAFADPVPEDELGNASTESSPAEDENQFEVKSRRQPQNGGHVQQVVRAFEAGLNFEDPLSPQPLIDAPRVLGGELLGDHSLNMTGDLTGLNEYGSNYEALHNSEKKRAFQKVDGDDCELPTPKRQFVEDRDFAATVEETSLKWSQQDK
ncbi:unnamed protein product [Linum trigynum]|uniref:Uncharacterized protein n=1 Tax=Linum trigynum TaxID=586398 RepID=A0AAV2CWN0_9ROSI